MLCIYIKKGIADISTEELEQALAALPEWRREAALRFRHEQGRRECAFSYLLLCRALRENTDYDFEREGMPRFECGEHGKPTIAGHPELHFNISHCRHAVAVAVSDSEVGVDVECTGRYRESLASYTMNDAELQLIASAPNPDEAFTTLWTEKEAVFKLVGTGITDDVRNLLSVDSFTYNIYICKELLPEMVLSVAQKEKKVPKVFVC